MNRADELANALLQKEMFWFHTSRTKLEKVDRKRQKVKQK